MKTSDFYYELPKELIAQHPTAKRDNSRLMLVNPATQSIGHTHFSEIINCIDAGDCLVLNNTKVIPARLLGVKRDTGVHVEFLLLNRRADDEWEVIVRPGRRLRQGSVVDFMPGELSAEITEVLPTGNRVVKFFFNGIWEEILDKAGTMPLPPYIKEKLADPSRYNTVYAKYDGSAAAPTAGLHFTPELLAALQAKGVKLAYVTLHVGLGTFRPVKAENIAEHHMHSEYYELPPETAQLINEVKASGHKIIAVGTTSTRTVESVYHNNGKVVPETGWTDIFIYPGFKFGVIDGLITNFHLPESTLMMLVSAIAGKDFIFSAYAEAVKEKYRFFSFGDAMFIQNCIPEGKI